MAYIMMVEKQKSGERELPSGILMYLLSRGYSILYICSIGFPSAAVPPVGISIPEVSHGPSGNLVRPVIGHPKSVEWIMHHHHPLFKWHAPCGTAIAMVIARRVFNGRW